MLGLLALSDGVADNEAPPATLIGKKRRKGGGRNHPRSNHMPGYCRQIFQTPVPESAPAGVSRDDKFARRIDWRSPGPPIIHEHSHRARTRSTGRLIPRSPSGNACSNVTLKAKRTTDERQAQLPVDCSKPPWRKSVRATGAVVLAPVTNKQSDWRPDLLNTESGRYASIAPSNDRYGVTLPETASGR